MSRDALPRPLTRRLVVRTGSRLAYAAPLIAATFKYTDFRAAEATHAHGRECGPCEESGHLPGTLTPGCVPIEGCIVE